jgi:hypothetical protein
MYHMRKEWLLRGALLAASLFMSLATVEILLRIGYDLETLFAWLQFEPEIATEGWERAFLRDYAQIRKRHALGNGLDDYQHEPDLGWDTPGHIRSARTHSLAKPPGMFRVLAIGDSYTYGAEVNAEQTYSRQLEKLLPGSEVINMGVSAYGIDQAVIKYLKYGRGYHPDLIIFGIFGPDYARTPLTFYRFAKPLFQVNSSGKLVLGNTPVPSRDAVYQTLRRRYWPLSYSFALLRQAYYRTDDDAAHEAYFRRWDPLIERILTELLEAAQQDSAKVLFLYIPIGQQFASDAGIASPCCERVHLSSIWKKLFARYSSLDLIDLLDELPRRYSRNLVYEQMIIRHDGQPTGHFTPFGNQAVAQVIADRLRRQSALSLPLTTR